MVLVVDDIRATAQDVKDLVELAGFTAIMAHDSTTALEKFSQYNPSICLVDLRLSKEVCNMDGIHLSEHFVNKGAQVILISAYMDHSIATWAAPLNIELLTKPFTPYQLEMSLQVALHKYRLNAGDEIFLTFSRNYQRMQVRLSDLKYIDTNLHITKVYTAHEDFIVNESLKEVEQMQGMPLMRIHRSCIVNVTWVTRASANTLWIHDETLAVGRKYRDAVKAYFGL